MTLGPIHVGQRVKTPHGPGVVVAIVPAGTVRTNHGRRRHYPAFVAVELDTGDRRHYQYPDLQPDEGGPH